MNGATLTITDEEEDATYATYNLVKRMLADGMSPSNARKNMGYSGRRYQDGLTLWKKLSDKHGTLPK